MKITSADIARLCNVSRATVDRALKNKPGIAPDTRKKICDLANQYGYHPNYLARSLSTGHSAAVGTIVFDLYNQHFSYMVSAIERYFSKKGIFTYICISDKDKQRERQIIDHLVARQVDGILLLPINDSQEYQQYLHSLNVPIVVTSNRLGDFPFVGSDNAGAAEAGMLYFFERGIRTVHFVCPPLRRKGLENIYAQEERANGYLNFMRAHPQMQGELIIDEDYLDRVEALIRSAEEKPGIFLSTDLYMLNVRRRLLDLGWDLNQCCSLMGFDGLDFLKHLTQRPPSIFYPAEAIGEEAARMLDCLMHGVPTPQEVLLPCPLLPGNIPE